MQTPLNNVAFFNFCEETGRDARAYNNIGLFIEFAEWVMEHQEQAVPRNELAYDNPFAHLPEGSH